MNLPPEVVSRYSAELAHMTQRLEELLQSQRQFEIEFVAASTERSALECPKIQHVCQDMSLLHCDAGVNGESDYRGASPEDSLELSGECGDRWSGAGPTSSTLVSYFRGDRLCPVITIPQHLFLREPRRGLLTSLVQVFPLTGSSTSVADNAAAHGSEEQGLLR